MENVPPFTVGLVPHYRLIEPLGGGGMGLVYKAFDERLNRPVALKFLPPEWSRDETARDRFMREARAASAVDHPNICTVHEIGRTDDGQLFIAMAFYDGETLKKKIERGPLPFPVAADFLLQTLRGLEKVHRCGIVHRDLKPANLMVTSDGIVKILDFGLATLALESRITHPGHVPGTVAYLSPEQARGEVAGPRSDLWALGVVLYEMLAGRRPFEGSAPGVVLDAIRKSDPPRLPVTRFGPVPPAVEEYVRKALAKRPAERFQSAGEMLWQVTDLRDTAARDSAQLPVDSREITPPLGPPLPPGRDAKGMRRAKILVAAVALAAAAGLGSFLWISERWIESPDEGVEAAGIGPAAAAPLRVGILKPRMLADPAPAADWPLLVQALLASELTGTAQLGVADPTTLNDRLEGALGSSRLERAGELAELLRRAGITLFLDGVIIQAEAGFRLVLNVVDVASGEIELSRERPVRSEGELPGVVKALAREILGYFQFEQMGGLQGEDLTPWISLKRHNLEALRAFLQATHYISTASSREAPDTSSRPSLSTQISSPPGYG